jgi:hypothetical protein
MTKEEIIKAFDTLRDDTLAFYEAITEETQIKLKVQATREQLKQSRNIVSSLEF